MYPAIPPITYKCYRTGTGSVTANTCGEYKFTLACVARNDDHKKKSKRHARKNCKSPLCPSCYRTVAGRMSKRIEQRFNSLDVLYRMRGMKLGNMKHLEFSYYPWLYDVDFVEKDAGKYIMNYYVQLLDSFMKDGFYAGVIIPHNWRKKHLDDGSECDWEPYYEYGKLVLCPREHEWIWGPHAHYVGYGYMLSSDEFHVLSGGWVYKNINPGGDRSIGATVFYLLTHSALYQKTSTLKLAKGYRYVGLFSDKLAKKDKTLSKEEYCICGINGCDNPLHKFLPSLNGQLQIVEDPFLDADQGPYLVKRKVDTWVLKDDSKQKQL